jgi:geranylgeranyl pyrophosphate synthase
LSDLAEGKKTLLVTHAYSALRRKARTEFLKIFAKKGKTLEDLEAVKKIFVKTKSLDYALEAIHSRLTQAQKILSGLKMNGAYRSLIHSAILKLFQHSQTIASQNI